MLRATNFTNTRLPKACACLLDRRTGSKTGQKEVDLKTKYDQFPSGEILDVYGRSGENIQTGRVLYVALFSLTRKGVCRSHRKLCIFVIIGHQR